jgi:hypothetical protein
MTRNHLVGTGAESRKRCHRVEGYNEEAHGVSGS